MGDNNSSLNLPPGFRFYPTDEELVVHFLHRKAALLPFHPDLIPDLQLYPYDPWDLDGKAMAEGNKWYFYSRRTQRRETQSGYWDITGADEPIYSSCNAQLKVGMKRYYSFYVGEPHNAIKTNWIMQEFRLVPDSSSSSSSSSSSRNRSSRRRNNSSNSTDYSKWVVCRVYEHDDNDDGGAELSCLDEVFLSLDDLDEISMTNY